MCGMTDHDGYIHKPDSIFSLSTSSEPHSACDIIEKKVKHSETLPTRKNFSYAEKHIDIFRFWACIFTVTQDTTTFLWLYSYTTYNKLIALTVDMVERLALLRGPALTGTPIKLISMHFCYILYVAYEKGMVVRQAMHLFLCLVCRFVQCLAHISLLPWPFDTANVSSTSVPYVVQYGTLTRPIAFRMRWLRRFAITLATSRCAASVAFERTNPLKKKKHKKLF